MTDLLIKNCLLLDTKDPQEILIRGGMIKEIAPKIIVGIIGIIITVINKIIPNIKKNPINNEILYILLKYWSLNLWQLVRVELIKYFTLFSIKWGFSKRGHSKEWRSKTITLTTSTLCE